MTNSNIRHYEHAFVHVLFPANYTQSGKDEWVCIAAQACNSQDDWPSGAMPVANYEKNDGKQSVQFKFSIKTALKEKRKYAFLMENFYLEDYDPSLNNYGQEKEVLQDAVKWYEDLSKKAEEQGNKQEKEKAENWLAILERYQ